MKKNDIMAVAYKPQTHAKAVVALLLERTGKNRNGSSSDYNFCRGCAQFGNETGFLTKGQLIILGKMYNRVVGKGRRRNWNNLD